MYRFLPAAVFVTSLSVVLNCLLISVFSDSSLGTFAEFVQYCVGGKLNIFLH